MAAGPEVAGDKPPGGAASAGRRASADDAPLAGEGIALRGRWHLWGERTLIMGIVNVTPDSFSGDGLGRPAGATVAAAVAQATAMVADGADVLDVGGESTRPGGEPVPADEEIERVMPVIEALRAALDVPISVDTSKAAVADAALRAGADLVNDVWALAADDGMAAVVAAARVPVVLMHNRSARATVTATIGGHYDDVRYDDVVAAVRAGLAARVAAAVAAGVDPARIVLDPGIGFGKTPAQNLELLDRTDELRALGYPLLVGPSRKSFIGQILDLPAHDRVEGTAAAVAVAIARGADIVRVHDVRAMARVARMTDAIVRRA